MEDNKNGHLELINPLRTEIVESEKARMDFLKYKLLAVAVLGSIGLGLNIHPSGSLDNIFILGIIPLVCLYVDLLCYHNSMRILVIGNYLANENCPYENFRIDVDKLAKTGKSKKRVDYFFELEDWVLLYSTFILSFSIFIFGSIMFHKHNKDFFMLILIIPGLLGMTLSIIISEIYNYKKRVLVKVSKILKDENRER